MPRPENIEAKLEGHLYCPICQGSFEEPYTSICCMKTCKFPIRLKNAISCRLGDMPRLVIFIRPIGLNQIFASRLPWMLLHEDAKGKSMPRLREGGYPKGGSPGTSLLPSFISPPHLSYHICCQSPHLLRQNRIFETLLEKRFLSKPQSISGFFAWLIFSS